MGELEQFVVEKWWVWVKQVASYFFPLCSGIAWPTITPLYFLFPWGLKSHKWLQCCSTTHADPSASPPHLLIQERIKQLLRLTIQSIERTRPTTTCPERCRVGAGVGAVLLHLPNLLTSYCRRGQPVREPKIAVMLKKLKKHITSVVLYSRYTLN